MNTAAETTKAQTWPILDTGPDTPRDERTPGVLLLESHPEDKRTAELINGRCWYVTDWERHDIDGQPHWFARSGFGIDAAVVAQLHAALAVVPEDVTRLNGAEAVMGFAAWLTCQDEATTFGSSHDCAPIVQRVKAFCEANNLGLPRDDYHARLVHPTNAARSTDGGNQP